jgi:hypothetical protein
MTPIYERTASFPVDQGIDQAMSRVIERLRSAGYRPAVEDSSVKVKTGSNTMVRLWGVFLPWGRNNVPVGMTVAFRERDNGCAVDVHTYDQLGWYLDARTNLTFKEESEAKMEVLLGEIREAIDQGPEEAPSVRKISGSSNNSPQSHAGTEASSQDPANRTNPLAVASFFLSFLSACSELLWATSHSSRSSAPARAAAVWPAYCAR